MSDLYNSSPMVKVWLTQVHMSKLKSYTEETGLTMSGAIRKILSEKFGITDYLYSPESFEENAP